MKTYLSKASKCLRLMVTDGHSRARRAGVEIQKSILLAFLFTGMFMLSPGVQEFVIAQAQPDPYEEALAKLDRFMELLQELRDQIDRTQFDVEALSFELAFEEPETIVQWMRENIAFEQYEGLLRGPQGTLMSRAGNALDQAVLLAKLLNDAGYEARVARGTLDSEDAEQLVGQMTQSLHQQDVFKNLEATQDIFKELGLVADIPTQDIPSDFANFAFLNPLGGFEQFENAKLETEYLLAELEKSGVKLETSYDLGQFITEAVDYFWVEYRIETSENWRGAHPSFAEDPALTLEVDEWFVDQVPEELLHKVRFDVKVERRLGETLEVHSLFSYERPSANQGFIPITFSHLSEIDPQLPPVEYLEKTLSESTMFAPIWDDQLPEGASFFDFNGNLIDPVAADDQAAGVFENVGDAFGNAAGALAGEENPDEFVALTAEWLDITLISPGGVETTERRTLFDRLGEENRKMEILELDNASESEVRAALNASHSLMVVPGSVPEGFVWEKYLEQSMSQLMMIEELVIAKQQQIDPLTLDSLNLGNNNVGQNQAWNNFTITVAMTDAGVTPPDHRVYRNKPTVMLHKLELGFVESTTPSFTEGSVESFSSPDSLVHMIEKIDIVSNSRRAFAIEGDLVAAAPEAVFAAGVWETYAEGLFIGPGDRTQSATTTFRKARESGLELTMITPTNREEAENLNLDATAISNLEKDLDLGFSIVVPQQNGNSPADIVGWYRIDAESGEALGMLRTGGGATEETESLATRILTWLKAKASAGIVEGLWFFLFCLAVDWAYNEFSSGVNSDLDLPGGTAVAACLGGAGVSTIWSNGGPFLGVGIKYLSLVIGKLAWAVLSAIAF